MVGRVVKRDQPSKITSKGCVGFSKRGLNALEKGIPCAKVSSMTATVTLDIAGRFVLPKPVRYQLHLCAGSKLRLDVIGDRMELTLEEPEVKIERREKLRVVVGWEGFTSSDAASATRPW
jgi:AbrB family looped-hinge helix DNA binding protein